MANVKIEIDSEALENLLTLKSEIEQEEKKLIKSEREYKVAKKALKTSRENYQNAGNSLTKKRKDFDEAISGLGNDKLKALLNASHIRPYLPTTESGKAVQEGGAFNDEAAGLVRERFKGKSVVEFDIKARKEIASQAGCSIDDVKATLDEIAERGDGNKQGRFTKYKLKKAS